MKKGKAIVGLLSTSLLVLSTFVYIQVFGADNKIKSEVQQEAAYESKQSNPNDLLRIISNSLLETGYYLGVEHRELSNNQHLIQVKLPRYNITQKVTEELMQRIENVIKENNFDREQLLIKVTSYIDKAELSSPKEQEKLDAFYEELNEDGGFFEQVGKELDKVGYSMKKGYGMVGTVYSTNDVRLHIVVPDNEEVNEQKQEEINNIFKDKLIKFKLDVGAFTVKVSRVDDPPAYKE